MWHIMRNPEYWEDAEEFKPQRFIDEYGGYKSDERNVPFMMGKRVCIGQVRKLVQTRLKILSV